MNLLYKHVDENDEKPCPIQVRIYAYDYCSEGWFTKKKIILLWVLMHIGNIIVVSLKLKGIGP